MASRVFSNTVFVRGFPSSMSRYDFLAIFGGSKGHINSVDFTKTHGEPKAAFIKYDDADSLPLALVMSGSHLFGHPHALNVQEVDERVLCDHVPGEMYDVHDALVNLQQILRSVLDSRDKSLALIDELRKSREQYKVQTDGREQDVNSELWRGVGQLNTTTERCVKLEAENRVLKERVKKAGEVERESSSKLTLASDRCKQLQSEVDALKTRLTEVDSELKAEQERKDPVPKNEADMRQNLEDITAQKEQTRENLANNTVLRLREELKTAQKAAEVSQSSLQWARSALEGMDSRVRALNAYVVQTQTKRQRAEESFMDERDTKRRLIEERNAIERDNWERAYKVERYEAERQQLEERLRMETQQRKRTEESLAEANRKLDRVIVTDSLTAAFLRLDKLVMRTVEGA